MQASRSQHRSYGGIIAELRRRHVLQIGGWYIAGAWLIAEITSFLLEQALAPPWTFKLLAAVYVVGFLVTIALAWSIQIEDDGSWHIDHSEGHVTQGLVAIGVGLAATIGLAWAIIPDDPPPPPYDPMPDSVGVLVLSSQSTSSMRAAVDLRLALLDGLDHSDELTRIAARAHQPPEDPVAFARRLDVESLAVLIVGRSGDSGTIERQWVDAVEGQLFWESTTAWQGDLMTVAHRMGAWVHDRMGAPPPEPRAFAGTHESTAFQAFVDALRQRQARSAAGFQVAIASLERALEIDEDYTHAYALLSRTIHDLLDAAGDQALDREQLEERATEAMNQALKLDSRCAEAIAALGLWTDTRELRVQAFERAIELDPDHHSSAYYYAKHLFEDDRLDDAGSLIRRALTYAPMEPAYLALQRQIEDRLAAAE